MSFFSEFIVPGGIVMYILLALSVLAIAVMIERAINLRRSLIIPSQLVKDIEEAVRKKDDETAEKLCRHNNNAMTRILWRALKSRGLSRPVLKEIIEENGRQEVAYLERYIGILGLIAAIAPLLGLLGTVIGMIEVFAVISLEGVGKAGLLAGGISKALTTTAAGLCVAIPALVAVRYFESRVDHFVIEIEMHALRFIELLKGER